MSSRLGIAIAITIGVVCLSVFGAFVLRDRADDEPAEPEAGTGVASALAGARAAQSPFAGLTEAQLSLAGRCLLVAIADENSERVEGLREAIDLGPYDGMLFVYGEDTAARFTMANTPLPLDIAFYTADGVPIDQLTMEPCPEGTDANCPTYGPNRPFRYALETPAGAGASGPIGPC